MPEISDQGGASRPRIGVSSSISASTSSATFRALTVNARANGVVQGGSSITQQLAKNLFLSNERTLTRKIKEAYLALWLERHLSKREILQLYLDRAYMGGGAFGVQAAAQFYFGKSARDINLAEAAMLAGLFKAPTKYSPHVNLPAARARANDVLSNMVDAGYMTEGQIYAARRNPATPDRATPRQDSPDWYLDFAYNEVQDARRRRQARQRSRADRAHRARLQSAAKGRETIEDQLREYGAGLSRSSDRPWSCSTVERRGAQRSSAGAIMARASSIAPPTRCASPARRSRFSSI